jgi:UDP-N-acetylmuramate dehydrogenase
MNIKQKINLSDFTTFGIGGEAKFFCVVSSVEEAVEVIAYAKQNNLKIFVLGGGSNVLVSEAGFDGLVIKNEIKGFKQDGVSVTFGCGENWDDVVQKTISLGLQGIECLSGIPGTSGGAVVQNIGAYGQTISDVIESAEVIKIETNQIQILQKNECEFAYRNSLFKKNLGKYLVTSATLNLRQSDEGEISFHSLQKYFIHKGVPTLTETRKAVIDTRASKGMVIMPGFVSYKSAGSFFKNPVISQTAFDKLKPLISCPDPWFWVQKESVKLSAACLVTQAGFEKGYVLDRAQISPKQPLAIINPGSATSSDIKNLAQKVKQAVLGKFGVELEEEIVYI